MKVVPYGSIEKNGFGELGGGLLGGSSCPMRGRVRGEGSVKTPQKSPPKEEKRRFRLP